MDTDRYFDLQYEEAEIRERLDNTINILREYNKKVDEYTYIRDLIVKDHEEKRQRLEEIKRELTTLYVSKYAL